jgi:hypothetical protein
MDGLLLLLPEIHWRYFLEVHDAGKPAEATGYR